MYKFVVLTQPNHMVMVVFLFVEIAIFLLILPMKINIKAHLSIDREKCILQLKFFGIQLVVVRVEIKNNRIRMLVNGKEKDIKRLMLRTSDKHFVIDKSAVNKLLDRSKAIIFVGGQDARASAILALGIDGILQLLLTGWSDKFDYQMYPNFVGECAVFQLDAKFSPSAIDLLELFYVYGIRRNIKANN